MTANNNQDFAITAIAANASNAAGTYSLSINGTNIFASQDTSTVGPDPRSRSPMRSIPRPATTGVTAGLSGGNLYLSAADGRDIGVGQTRTGAQASGGLAAGSATTLNGASYGAGALGTVGVGNRQLRFGHAVGQSGDRDHR